MTPFSFINSRSFVSLRFVPMRFVSLLEAVKQRFAGRYQPTAQKLLIAARGLFPGPAMTLELHHGPHSTPRTFVRARYTPAISAAYTASTSLVNSAASTPRSFRPIVLTGVSRLSMLMPK